MTFPTPANAAAALDDYFAALELQKETSDGETLAMLYAESDFLVQAFWALRMVELSHLSKQELAQLLLATEAEHKAMLAARQIGSEAYGRVQLEFGAVRLARDAKRRTG